MTDDKAALLALADRVEALTGPCRETDAEILMVIGGLRDGYVRAIEHGKERPYFWHGTDEKRPTIYAARFTESLDAAMTLVPPKSLWSICDMEDGPFAQIVRPMPCGGYVGGLTDSHGNTPALALTAAALRARAAKEAEA